jgi:hypothetical protein
MSLVQLLVETETTAAALAGLLDREGFSVSRSAEPEWNKPGTVVADRRALERHPDLLDHAERVVLIAPNDPKFLASLWRHNIRTVVFDTDPLDTILLAIIGSEIGGGAIQSARRKSTLVVINSRAS